MDWLQFISSMFSSLVSLAWPVAFVCVVAIFRKELMRLLPQLRVRHKDWEASFRLDKAEAEAAQLPSIPDTVDSLPTPEETGRFEEIAKLAPRAAILEQRRSLEEFLRSYVEGMEGSPKPGTFAQVVRFLRSRGDVDKHTSAILDDLRQIGNAAAHGGSTEYTWTYEEAVRFKKLVDQVTHNLLV